jgi:hypothetical protein
MNAMLPGEIDAGQSAMIKRREKLSTLGGISAGRTAMSRNSVLVHARVCSTPRRRRTGGRRLSAYNRSSVAGQNGGLLVVLALAQVLRGEIGRNPWGIVSTTRQISGGAFA